MNRVTIVNLAGHAWHVEEAGVQSLDAWLDDARARLAADPDRDELVLDFERAIGDRFAHVAPGDRDVVTAAQVGDVLAALGTVEPADDGDQATATVAAAPPTPPPSDGDTPLRDRRLYRLTGDDALLAGVCAGLAAYLRVDVTVVRVLVILLTILTSGGVIIGYILMAIIVPEAKSPEERAEALGTGTTAQEMLARARDQASPALATLGSFLMKATAILLVILRGALLVAMVALLAAWAVAIGSLAINSGFLLDLFDTGTSAWIVGLWVTCIAWIPISILLGVERGFAAINRTPRPRSKSAGRALGAAWIASIVVAISGFVGIPATHSSELRSVADGHGSMTIDGEEVCVRVDTDDLDSCPASTDHAIED